MSRGGTSKPVRAGIVVTGTEVLDRARSPTATGPGSRSGSRSSGSTSPTSSASATAARTSLSALRFCADEELDLVVTSGGLGPTADDLTAEVVGRLRGPRAGPRRGDGGEDRRDAARVRAPLPDGPRGAARSRTASRRWCPRARRRSTPPAPRPGLVVPAGSMAIIVLPGPPRELHAMWPHALETAEVRAVLDRTPPLPARRDPDVRDPRVRARQEPARDRGRHRPFAARDHDLPAPGRARDRHPQPTRRRAARRSACATRSSPATRPTSSATGGKTIDEQVAELLAGHRIGVAESCTGGLLAARLTRPPGASAYVAGGVVAYSNEAKSELLGVPAELIERHGAVSPEVAEAMADGALGALRRRRRVRGHGDRRARRRHARRSPSATSASAPSSPTATTLARDPAPAGTRDDVRDRSVAGRAAHAALAAARRGAAAVSAEATPEPLRDRALRAGAGRRPARAPASARAGPTSPRDGWDAGMDVGYLRELCAHWASDYDPRGCAERWTSSRTAAGTGSTSSGRAATGTALPILLVHGWPGGPIEFLELIPRLVAAGHDVVVPSLPGYAFSEAPDAAAQRRRGRATACAT